MSTSPTLQETLETKYPLLDSSLLAALISDLPDDADASPDSLQHLHDTLAQLSLKAQPELDNISNPDDAQSFSSSANSTSTVATSVATNAPTLDFVQALFPHISRVNLIQILNDYYHQLDSADELDLSAVVDDVLTLEYTQDLSERGLTDDADKSEDWSTSTGRGKHRSAARRRNQTRHKHTVALVDTRQRRDHASQVPPAGTFSPPGLVSTNPWVRLTSLATRLSDLLKTTPPGYFMSHFHSPAVQGSGEKSSQKGEGDAVRAALSDLASHAKKSVDETTICTVRDVVIGPEDHEILQLNADGYSRVENDVRLCVAAAENDPATAIDLILLLRELDDALFRGHGVVHMVEEAGPQISTAPFPSTYQPPSVPSPPSSQPQQNLPRSTPSERGWTLVEPRRPGLGMPHPHAQFVPGDTVRKRRASHPMRGSVTRTEKGGGGDSEEPGLYSVAWYRAREHEIRNQRIETLREAARHWKAANAKNHGGDVAFFYAEKARKLLEEQKSLALDAARATVAERRTINSKLDLHGLSAAEACTIVSETLSASPPAPVRPLEIITGRGIHSPGRVGVLGPAVLEMLRSDGWRVTSWDGGMTVRGRV